MDHHGREKRVQFANLVCQQEVRPPIADSTASDTTIAEDTMIDEFPQDEEADVNQYISVWRSY